MAIAQNFPNIKPSLMLSFADTKQLDSRITFTRATTATYYDGVTTAMAEQNLFTYSQDLTNGYWNKNNTTVTGNVSAAPDGTTTSNLLAETTGNNDHRLALTNTLPFTSGLTYTYSIYAKVGTGATAPSSIQVYATNFVSSFYVNFNISTGTVGTSNGFTGTITSVGSGWYRLTATATATTTTSSSSIGVSFNNNNNSATFLPSYTGATTSDVFLWGAQLEQRSAVTAYTATTTQAITNYIPVLQTAASGVARFDNNPTTGESLGLLIEEQRTNLVTYSAQFDNAAWTKTNATVTADTIVAPDGTLTSDKLVENSTNSFHYIYSAASSVTSGTAYTYTVFAKAGERSYITIQLFGDSRVAIFNLSNGTVATTFGSPTSTSIQSVGNGWYRCSVTASANATTGVNSYMYIAQDASNTAYTGNGFSGIYIWGAQLEAGAFATSYIPTVASTVTRNADAASMTGTNFSSWFNNNEFTLYAEAENRNGIISSTNYHFATISDGTSANSQLIRIEGADNRPSTFGSYNGSANQWLLYGTAVAKGSFAKLALAYAFNNVGFSSNAGTVGTDTVAQIPSQNVLNIGANSTNAQQICGCIKKIAYYPLRVTNAQLQALTS